MSVVKVLPPSGAESDLRKTEQGLAKVARLGRSRRAKLTLVGGGYGRQ